MARRTSGDSVCAPAGMPAVASNTTTSTQRVIRDPETISLRRGCTVDAREVVQNRAPLVGRKSAQLLPRRWTELDRRARVDLARRREHVVPRRRRRLAPARIVALFLLERATGVEQATEELLLACERARVEPAVVERFGELPGFPRELRRPLAPRGVTHLLQLIGDAALLACERPRERLSRSTARAVGHAHHPLRLGADLPLLLRHLLHLLDHLAEAGRALRAVRALAVARQGGGRLRQRVGGLTERPGLLRLLSAAARHTLGGLSDLGFGLGHRARRPR